MSRDYMRTTDSMLRPKMILHEKIFRRLRYARHGFAFKKSGSYYPHYMHYDWYQNMDHRVVNDLELNEYKKANRDLIVEIEREEGYRS